MASVETRADEAGMRFDRWFRAHYPAVSFGHLRIVSINHLFGGGQSLLIGVGTSVGGRSDSSIAS